MPFTAAHPAIVLPLNRVFNRYVSLTALVIGSVTPDFEYFLRMQVKSVYSHTLLGLFYFDLPLGLILFWVYNVYIKEVLISNLPLSLKRRFCQFNVNNQRGFTARQWLIVVASLIIGVASHLFWDAFTHPTGWFVEHSNILTESFLGVPYFKLLQHSSTLVGLCVIFYNVRQLPETSAHVNLKYAKFWTSYILIFTVIFLSRIICLLINQQKLAIGLMVVSIISAALSALILQCLLVRYKTK